MLTVTLALVGVLRDVGTSKAQQPVGTLPVQPFLADATGGMADTTLGKVADVDNYTLTTIPRGSRTTLPWIYSGPGWGIDVDKNMTDETPLGTVSSLVDALCDSTGAVDDILEDLVEDPAHPGQYICTTPPTINPLIWEESTTAVEGPGGDEWLKPLVPPYSWLARHTAKITNICISGTISNATTSVLNTIYTSVPFSPNGSAFTATTKLGGDPVVPINATCLDSPQTSTSITSLYHAPDLEGNADGPCNKGTYACADAAIYGVWTDNTVSLAAGATTTKAVKSVNLNNGPENGAFSAHWEVELTNSTLIDAGWDASYTKTATDAIPDLAKSVSTEQNRTLHLQCKGTSEGEGLVVLKKVLWPANHAASAQMTKDTYADDNAFVFVVKVICGTDVATLVDKEVIWVKPVSVKVGTPPNDKWYAQDHLVLAANETRAVIIDELKANHHTAPVDGKEWLVAEVADSNLVVTWEPNSVTIDQGGTPVSVPGVTSCGDGCITYTVSEPQGQSDIQAQLNIQCAAVPVPGLYSVVLKAIDAPVGTGIGESKPSDNAQRSVIKVWCGAGAGVPDSIEDANGLYARWTVFQSVGLSSLQIAAELRKPYQSPPSIPSDTGYVERIVDLQCFWMDDDGCFTDSDNTKPCDSLTASPPGNNDGAIEENESWKDYDLVQLGGIDTVDEDGDCLMNAAFAQPSHPVDELDEPTGKNCDAAPADPRWVVYSEEPNVVHHDTAADQDCDGLVDGIERAWGSNPQLDDSDGDNAKDFVEIFQQTNPLNSDTDGDGYKDAPVPTSTNTNTAYDNCPGAYNPGQENNDGLRRDNGDIVGSWASNPNQDYMGDACDPDDDNDGLPDTYEIKTAGSNPFALDSDGNTINDGAEVINGKNPMVKASFPVWSDAVNQLYYRGCHINLPTNLAQPLWAAEYDLVDDNVEMDIDGDGIKCTPVGVDPDSDNGTGTKVGGVYVPGPVGYADRVEAFRYALGIANYDTDGDGCPDWIEITDVSGDRKADINDVFIVAAKAFPPTNVTDAGTLARDLDASMQVANNDVFAAALNSAFVRGATASTCTTPDN
jgi:hypothetical protein